MSILQEGLDEYLADLIPERGKLLQEMEEIAEENGFPIVGPQVRQVLMQYAILVDAKRIFELGSGYGYSAMWWAKATDEDCHIWCTDSDPANKVQADGFFTQAGYQDRITFLVGDALTQLEKVDGDFDIIYCDVNKEQYPEVYKQALPRLRKGGLLITDNTLWSGRVLEDNPSESTRGVIKYNQLAFNDDRVLSMILPIRDGVCVSLKL